MSGYLLEQSGSSTTGLFMFRMNSTPPATAPGWSTQAGTKPAENSAKFRRTTPDRCAGFRERPVPLRLSWVAAVSPSHLNNQNVNTRPGKSPFESLAPAGYEQSFVSSDKRAAIRVGSNLLNGSFRSCHNAAAVGPA